MRCRCRPGRVGSGRAPAGYAGHGQPPLLAPAAGGVYLDGTDLGSLPTKFVATQLGLLPQSPVAPDGILVADLVGRGRYPHQGWFRGRRRADDEAVARALTATGTLDLASRPLDELSGGQRQRVWVAMALAQQTDLLLLDEPTSFLDVNHQIEVLDLLTDLNRREGTTIVLVLHDLNLAGRYADHLIAMKQGEIAAEGPPAAVITEPTIAAVFGIPARVLPDPVSHTPMVVPIGRHHSGEPAHARKRHQDELDPAAAAGARPGRGLAGDRPG